jgi:flavin-dependent dehydrogenase
VSVERVGECWHLFDQDDVLYKCHHLVAADGPNSSIGTEVFQYTYTNIAGIDYLINFDREIQNDTMEMYFGNNIAPHGYAWFFPYSKTSANIGILTKKPCNLRSFYNKFLDSTIREKYGNYTVGENKSGVLPISGFFSQVEKDNAYLVGDAGAFTDPIFEGGIGFGLFTGRMVADAINQGSPGRYQAAIDALSFTGKDLYDAQEWFYTLSDKDFDEFTQIMSTDQSIASLPEKFTNNNEFIHFIKTWKNAKEYLW